MDGEGRASSDPVTNPAVARLLAEPRRVGFYRAVALMERAMPGAARVGELGPLHAEAVRFRHDPSLTFSSSDVSTITRRHRDVNGAVEGALEESYEITTTFLGLTGVVSPLPTFFAEEVLHEDADRPAQREFLDIFHHRILSLLYRSHTRYAYTQDYTSDSQDLWSHRVLALAGIDTFDGRKPTSGLSLARLLRLAPMLASKARTAEGLVALVTDVMSDALAGADVTLEQFTGRWVTIEDRQLLRLGLANTTLGEDLTIGRRVFDRGGKFRLVLGPLRRRAFQRFLPDGDALPVLRDAVTLYVRDPLEFDIELVLAPGETPALRLGYTDDTASRLGMDAWLNAPSDRETRVIVPIPSATSSSAPATREATTTD